MVKVGAEELLREEGNVTFAAHGPRCSVHTDGLKKELIAPLYKGGS